MRDMRMNLVLISCLLLAGCGDDNGLNNGGSDLSASLDMTVGPPGPDMAVRKPNGVACGSTQCAVGQSCCVLTDNGQVTGASCIAAGGACGGSVVACDGPEDCSGGGGTYCCATVNLIAPDPDAGVAGGVSGGAASCTADCQASVDLQNQSLTSRLCTVAADCTGLSVASPLGIIPLDKCCSTPMAPGTPFRGHALFSHN